MTTTPNQPDREREARVEAMARVLYCAMEDVSAEHNQAHLGCYFAPFNVCADDETKQMFNEYRVGARAALAFRDADRAREVAKLLEALNAAHYYIDASDRELSDAGMTRGEALYRARMLRAPFDPSAGDTPATPLLDDETVERCAEVADEMLLYAAQDIATAIRALKGPPKQ